MASPEAPLRYVGIDRQSAAFRLMKQMGWEEGEGIGKDKQGIKGYIRVQNKQDYTGIGVEKKNVWAFDTTQFDNILKKLKVESVDVKVEDHKDDVNKNTFAASEYPDPEEQKPRKASWPQGRYSKRERGKLVKAYPAKDLEGILVKKLGEQPFSVKEEPDMEVCDISYLGIKDWWGYKYGFVSGGFLGAKSNKRKGATAEATSGSKKIGFAEEDQENLYHLTQDRATTGKQGLGIKDGSIKVGGVRFKGKKSSFDDSDKEDSVDTGPPKQQDSKMLETNSSKKTEVKLKKLCRQLLRQAPSETLKLNQLKVQIDQQTTSVFSCFSSEKDALSFLRQTLEGSSKFCIQGKRVALCKRSSS